MIGLSAAIINLLVALFNFCVAISLVKTKQKDSDYLADFIQNSHYSTLKEKRSIFEMFFHELDGLSVQTLQLNKLKEKYLKKITEIDIRIPPNLC